MRVTFLGTGTSHGVPVIGCRCAVCRSPDPRNQRLRPSVWVQTERTSVLIDATPDFRQQAIRADIARLDAVLLTHTHADHFLGLDDLRTYTTKQAMKMPVYGSAEAMADVERVFNYACTEKPAWPTLPRLNPCTIAPNQELQIGDLSIRAVCLPHGWATVFGYTFGRDFVYLTDCSAVTTEAIEILRGVTVLALDALRDRPHPTHLTIAQAREVAGQINARLTLFTHLCHEAEHVAVERDLPESIRVAYDGLTVEIDGTRITKLA